MNEQSKQYLKTVINDRRDLIHQVAKLKLENSKLQEQLLIQRVSNCGGIPYDSLSDSFKKSIDSIEDNLNK